MNHVISNIVALRYDALMAIYICKYDKHCFLSWYWIINNSFCILYVSRDAGITFKNNIIVSTQTILGVKFDDKSVDFHQQHRTHDNVTSHWNHFTH